MCSNPFNDLNGFHHNALYHVFQVFSKAILVFASRRMILYFMATEEEASPGR
jgi:hypothetical protein